MKNSLLKFYMLAFFLVSDFVMFADDDPTEVTPEDDDPHGPINTKLIWLAIVGIAFMYHTYSRRKQKAA
jgi:hypothetical protein